ncbi:MAG: hypothetical protein HYX68_25965 [Planctomycetes bacterium]|nr:hypothetical protein [Planctomycetota bacterium]
MASPRLLLFGTPGAGKTALLGALAQAAPALPADDLAELRTNTYDDQLSPTEKTQTYNLRLQEKGSDPFSAVAVLDCGGQAALDMLRASEPFTKKQAMHKPVLAADVVLLTVDASLSPKQLGEEFQQFGRWLRGLHHLRGRRVEVGDMPVFLVLTKCDLLAKKDDTFAKWTARIDEAKRRVEEKFREYLDEQAHGFGTVKLLVWATAIKRPALADRSSTALEPYGVAELFHQGLREAHAFQTRRHTAQVRLQNLFAGLLGSIALLALIVAFLYEFQPSPRGERLEEKARALLPRPDASTVGRLQGGLKKLQEREAKLAQVQNDAAFEGLPEETQEAINHAHDEVARYVQLYRESQHALKLPYLAKDEKEFDALEKTAKAFVVPDDWKDTLLGRRADRCHKEFTAVRLAARAEQAWLRAETLANYTLTDASDRLYRDLRNEKKYEPAALDAWRVLKMKYDAQIHKRPSPPRRDSIPGVSRFKYENLGLFAEIKKERSKWRKSQEALQERAEFIEERIPRK